MDTTTTVVAVASGSAVVRLGPRAWAVARRESGRWSIDGSGPAGRGGRWQHESLDRLAADVIEEHRRFRHIACLPSRRAALVEAGIA